jgi:hypothetical protein
MPLWFQKTIAYSFSHYDIRFSAGIPVYCPGVRRPMSDVLQPLEETPLSKISREPWWWGYPSLRPHLKQLKAIPSHLRDSYLSPVKSTFHWYEHPFRQFGKQFSALIIHCNINILSTPTPPFRFSDYNFVCNSILSHSHCFNHPISTSCFWSP